MPRSIAHREVAYSVDPARVEPLTCWGRRFSSLRHPTKPRPPCITRGTISAGVSIPLHSHGDPETFVMISSSVEGLVYSEEEQKWVRIGSGDIFHAREARMAQRRRRYSRNARNQHVEDRQVLPGACDGCGAGRAKYGTVTRTDPAVPRDISPVWILECFA